VREGAGLNHVPHGELPCDLGEALSGCLGSGNRQRGELDGGGPAAAAGTRVPAIVLLGHLAPSKRSRSSPTLALSHAAHGPLGPPVPQRARAARVYGRWRGTRARHRAWECSGVPR
jgi:hypothetical protein